jgi:hypothetical protein
MRAKCNGPAGLPSSAASKIDPMEGIEAKDTPAEHVEEIAKALAERDASDGVAH